MQLTEAEKRSVGIVSELSNVPQYQVKEVFMAMLQLAAMDIMRARGNTVCIPLIATVTTDYDEGKVDISALSPTLAGIMSDLKSRDETALHKRLKKDIRAEITKKLDMEEVPGVLDE